MTKNKIIPYNPELKELARNLRKNMTHAEVLLWQKIRRKSLGYQFHRQVPMLEYIVDFYCHELKLAIEVDGGAHEHPETSVNDLTRQKEIESYNVHFLRFDNKEIKQDINSVIHTIENWIKLNAN
ncbi:endonuclease domain-containing protein [Fodinibius sp.]|uniref:endonuclease domain-containing protein n=1 Tax=Fodinibius sp. TaxID=1872440 RepID=UPI002ACDDB6C|nr:endonuclease domain-containing protein [Fodinibius sp.]MDZ7660011.1 endonuclease domain-containing protein [Fodinibius sp.]